VGRYKRFGEHVSSLFSPEDGGSTFHRNGGKIVEQISEKAQGCEVNLNGTGLRQIA
jgi:hypothetical protein